MREVINALILRLAFGKKHWVHRPVWKSVAGCMVPWASPRHHVRSVPRKEALVLTSPHIRIASAYTPSGLSQKPGSAPCLMPLAPNLTCHIEPVDSPSYIYLSSDHLSLCYVFFHSTAHHLSRITLKVPCWSRNACYLRLWLHVRGPSKEVMKLKQGRSDGL